jgi:hypothetical protein
MFEAMQKVQNGRHQAISDLQWLPLWHGATPRRGQPLWVWVWHGVYEINHKALMPDM